MTDDNVTVGLTEETHEYLQRLKEEGVFSEMVDAYRFGIALAIANEFMAPEGLRQKTLFNVGTLDPDGSIRNLITELFPDAADRPYATAQRLAEAGVAQLGRLHDTGHLKFGELFKEVMGIGQVEVSDS